MPDTHSKVIEILHAEDNAADAQLVNLTLREAGLICNMTLVKSREEFERAVRESSFDLILSDFSLPSFGGREAFEIARKVVPDIPFVFVSGTIGEEAAIQALVDGATDYVLKSMMTRLVPAVKRAIRESESKKKLKLAERLRELTLEDLKKSEARFRGVLESAPDSALIIDSAGKITFANRRAELMFGFQVSELVGRSLDLLVPDRFKNAHSGHIGKYRNEPHGRAMNSGLELYARRKDGTEFPADIMLSPLTSDHDISVLAMIRDVTDSKNTEKALRESERLFRAIFEASPVAMLNSDLDGNIIKCNLAATKLLGYGEAELLGLHYEDFTHPEDKQLTRRIMSDLISGKSEVSEFEKRYIRKNGQAIRVHLTTSAIRNEDGSIRYLTAIIEDITQKWEAGEALRRSEERYRSVVDNARDAIYTASSNGILLSLNPAFEIITGWKREDWLGKSFTDLIHPDDRQRAIESFRKTLGGDLTDAVLYRIKTKSNEHRVGEFNTTRLVLEDGTVGVLGVARDVTVQLAMEEKLRHSQKMESIGTLAGGIAHDFNNILGIIIGYASLTMRLLNRDNQISRNIRSIESAAQRGVSLVRQLLMFARKQERSLDILDVNDTVADVCRMIDETFPKVIAINLKKWKNRLIIYGDQTEIHQAVLNLCVNARDAMMEDVEGKQRGGTLTIATGVVQGNEVRSHHHEAAADEYVEISVSDTGAGIDEATLSRVFEPFFTTKEKGKGTGLGLSMVYGVVTGHNGFIEVSSKLSQGTTFTMFFPMHKSIGPPAEAREPEPRLDLNGSETILIVEDEPGLRSLLNDILTDRGYKVIAAEDGQSGLAAFLDNREISLVVSDIGLPKVGGLDLYQSLKKLNPDLRVVMVSGFVDDKDRERIMKSGVNAFIQKPYEPLNVIKKIREVLDYDR